MLGKIRISSNVIKKTWQAILQMNNNFSKTPLSANSAKAAHPKSENLPFLVLGIFAIVTLLTAAGVSNSFAESQTTIQLTDELNLEKTEVIMNVPEDNVLPWGTVMGTVNDPAQGYPVIIQFFNEENGGDPIHVAQVEVKGDDTYEYKFRVRDVNLETGEAINIFEGDYTVKIFKVIKSPLKEIDLV